MPYMVMDHEIDPKQKLIDEIGDLSTVEVFNNDVVVAVYMRPEKTKSGLIMPDQHLDEDRHQSKVGIIVKMGPRAFEPNDAGWYEGDTFNVGDWVVFRPSDGWLVTIHGVLCRLFKDTAVAKLRIQTPDEVW